MEVDMSKKKEDIPNINDPVEASENEVEEDTVINDSLDAMQVTTEVIDNVSENRNYPVKASEN